VLASLAPGSLSGVSEVTLIGHGVKLFRRDTGAIAVRIGRQEYTAQQLARALADAGWQGGTLRLAVCKTGTSCFLGTTYGDELATALRDTAVIAPKGKVNVINDVPGLPQVRPSDDGPLVAPGKEGEYFINPLQNPWVAPFFYEDRRHVFYVTTSERIAQISQWDRYGIIPDRVQPRLAIPPLVSEPENVIPERYGSIVTAPNMRVADRAPIGRLVSEDAPIDKVIGTAGTVRYGDKEIGPMGVVSNRQMRRG
jgi:hypothetical protein